MATPVQLFCRDCQQPREFRGNPRRCGFCGYKAKLADYWNATRLIDQWRRGR